MVCLLPWSGTCLAPAQAELFDKLLRLSGISLVHDPLTGPANDALEDLPFLGIVWAWTGVAVSKPSFSTAVMIAGSNPNE